MNNARFKARIGIDPVGHYSYDNFGFICKRHGFSWSADGGCAVASEGDQLDPLVHRVELLTNDLKAAKIKVRRIQVVETILDVEEE